VPPDRRARGRRRDRDRPLVEHAPLYRDGPEGGPVVQYDMKSAETVGLIKFDFLGLKTLDQLRDAVAMVERNTGEHVDLLRLPYDDEATFQLLQRGDGLGIFQVESTGCASSCASSARRTSRT
jgi:DNA polymerase-3 subunit alpha